jgi:iron complex transport system ATP-binding protein
VALVRLFKRIACERIVVTVLHDLPLALRADHLVVMQAGRVVAQGDRGDAEVHRALERVFEQAVRISFVEGHWTVLPRF